MAPKPPLEDLKHRFLSPESAYYLAGVIACTAVGLILCSKRIQPPARIAHTILETFLLALLCVWISLVWSKDEIKSLPGWGLGVFIAVAPIASLFSRLPTVGGRNIGFWLGLGLWTAFGVLIVVNELKNKSPAERFIAALGVAWTVSGFIISAGTTKLLPYSIPAIAGMKSVNVFLDVRYILGTIFIGSVCVVSIRQAFQEKAPSGPHLEAWELDESTKEGLLDWIAHPFIILANAALLVLTILLTYLLRTARIVSFYFMEIGRRIGEIFRFLLTERETLKTVIQLISIFTFVVLAVLAAVKSTPYVLLYLQASRWESQVSALALGCMLIGCVSICVGGIFLVIESRDGFTSIAFEIAIEPVVVAFATLLSVVFVAGLLLFVLSRVDTLQIQGFGVLGLFSCVVSIFVLGGIIKVIYVASRKASNPDASPDANRILRGRRR